MAIEGAFRGAATLMMNSDTGRDAAPPDDYRYCATCSGAPSFTGLMMFDTLPIAIISRAHAAISYAAASGFARRADAAGRDAASNALYCDLPFLVTRDF